jgi:TPR repeat protein
VVFHKAAEQNKRMAQFSLGNRYRWRVAKDEVEAVKWYRKAAEQNYALLKQSGWFHLHGLGVVKIM